VNIGETKTTEISVLGNQSNNHDKQALFSLQSFLYRISFTQPLLQTILPSRIVLMMHEK
jgi:hypothetical protein